MRRISINRSYYGGGVAQNRHSKMSKYAALDFACCEAEIKPDTYSKHILQSMTSPVLLQFEMRKHNYRSSFNWLRYTYWSLNAQ